MQVSLVSRNDGQAVHFEFGQDFADALRVKLETWTSEDFGILSKDSLVMTNLDSTRQNQRENLGGISLRLEQARHGDFSIHVGHRKTGSAVDNSGLLERGLRLKSPDTSQKRAGGCHRRRCDAKQHGDWLALGGNDQVVLAG